MKQTQRRSATEVDNICIQNLNKCFFPSCTPHIFIPYLTLVLRIPVCFTSSKTPQDSVRLTHFLLHGGPICTSELQLLSVSIADGPGAWTQPFSLTTDVHCACSGQFMWVQTHFTLTVIQLKHVQRFHISPHSFSFLVDIKRCRSSST